ncbi:MAG: hypothetical protein DMG07_13775 [Acidobacteria bacterium]|nr:MAG: hypothetical protein DMG07_13775 [Acidobacteriota bacterium]
MKEVALARIAHGRSGDKGDTCNCGIIARRPEYYPVIAAQVTAERVKAHFGDFCQGAVRRYDLPKIHAFNFVLEHALGGGGTASLRIDTQGKTYAAALMRVKVQVPDDWDV